MSTFTIVPEFGAQATYEPRVSNLKFGDGYEQRQSTGINTMAENWNLQFSNRTKAESDSFKAFLKALGGVEAFYWTPPYESTPKKFKCQKWTNVIGKGNLYQMTAVFEEVFES